MAAASNTINQRQDDKHEEGYGAQHGMGRDEHAEVDGASEIETQLSALRKV